MIVFGICVFGDKRSLLLIANLILFGVECVEGDSRCAGCFLLNNNLLMLLILMMLTFVCDLLNLVGHHI